MGMKLQEEGIFSKKGLHESSGYQRWRGLIKWKGGIDILYQENKALEPWSRKDRDTDFRAHLQNKTHSHLQRSYTN